MLFYANGKVALSGCSLIKFKGASVVSERYSGCGYPNIAALSHFLFHDCPNPLRFQFRVRHLKVMSELDVGNIGFEQL